MKKVLLATAAMVAFTGVASAEVSLSGSARFGLKYIDNAPIGVSSTSLEKRMTINIDASTETDGGLEFGGRIRIRSDEGGLLSVPVSAIGNPTNTAVNGASVYVKSGGLKLTVGNICGAIECMPGLYTPVVGLDGNGYSGLATNTAANGAFGYWGWSAYSSRGNGANGVELEYSVGDFSAHVSYASVNSFTASPNIGAIYLAYTFGDWTAAVAVQDSSVAAVDKTVLTVQGKLGDFGVGLSYADNNGTDKVVLNGSYTTGATTVSAFIGDENSVLATDNPWGLGVTYDLGGATLVGGYSNSEVGVKRATAGVRFSF